MDGHDPRRADAAFDAAEILRRLANVVRLGTVAEVDLDAARVQVQYDTDADGDPLLSAWLPWLTGRAGADRTWWAPTVGEQVVVLAPGGELPQAVALPALYRDDHPAPADEASKHVTRYVDGIRIEVDTSAHRYGITVPAGGELVLTCGGSRMRMTDAAIYRERV